MMFYKECCCERKTAKDNCTAQKLYDVFKAWAKTNGEYTPAKQGFWKELARYLSDGDKDKLLKTIQGIRYPTFTLTMEAKTAYKEAYGYDFPQS